MTLKISIMALEKSENRLKKSFPSITPKLLTILNYLKKQKNFINLFYSAVSIFNILKTFSMELWP